MTQEASSQKAQRTDANMDWVWTLVQILALSKIKKCPEGTKIC
jgi:hypothetical protein